MSKIDTSNWKELKIGDVFEKIDTGKIDGKAGDFPTSRDAEHEIPLLTSSSQNQGLTRFASRSVCPTILSNAITVASNGAAGVTFYQEDEFAVLQDAYAIRPIGRDIPNRECGLFLASIIGARLRGNFDWSNKANWSKVRDLKIKLPVIETEEIDWRYMEKRIAELEAERIAKLEAYLTETGLGDYELTEEDKEILATKLIDSSKRGNESISDYNFRSTCEFKIKDLFDIKNSHSILKSSVSFSRQGHPYLTAQVGNNAVSGHIIYDEAFLDKGRCIFIGGKTLTVSYQEEDFFSNDSHNLLLYPKDENLNSRVYEYLVTAIYKSLKPKYSWNDSISFRKIQKDTIILPVTSDLIPDYRYMERYIRAIEKLVIKDVVRYKDEISDNTREILNRN